MTNHRRVKLYEANSQDTKKQNSKCTELMLWTVRVVQAHQPHFTPDIWEQLRNVFYISLVFSNACHVLSQCNTRLRLLYYFVNFNTVSLIKSSPTAAISHISSAPVTLNCSQNLSKLTNQRVYHILVNQKDQQAFFHFSLPRLCYFVTCCFSCCTQTNWMPEETINNLHYFTDYTFFFLGN